MGHTTPPAGAADLVTPKLGALEFYQLALDAPTPAAGSFDATAAGRGKTLFEGAAKCAACHVPPTYTDAGWNMHSAAEIGIDDFQAKRSPDEKYRTTPLRGLFAHAKGGFYHDGRFATLDAVVGHYDTAQTLGLTAAQRADLVEYLKSL
jgi:cytochrome c peroxidase